MSRTRFLLTFFFALSAISAADAKADSLFVRKAKAVDEAKARALIETLKSDPDEKKRKIAADELGGADPRMCPDAAPTLITALRKDTSAGVRAEAANSLRQLNEVVPQAGAALEMALDNDPSPLVRLAAKRALWVYHLNGYRTAKNEDGTGNQTIEPPIASPSGPRQVVAFIPAPPVPVASPPTEPIAATSVPQLPPVAARPTPQPGPRLFWPNILPGPRSALRAALNLPPLVVSRDEPPLAKKPAVPAVTMSTPPKHTPEPPLVQHVPVPTIPEYVPTLPAFQPDLPSVVSPPLPISKLKPPK